MRDFLKHMWWWVREEWEWFKFEPFFGMVVVLAFIAFVLSVVLGFAAVQTWIR